MNINTEKYRVKTKNNIILSDIATTSGVIQPNREQLQIMLTSDTEKIAKLQYRLYAENRQSLLIILQGLDGAGKDGTIKHIMSGVNPQGVLVHSFKHPTGAELEHDYLWRHYIKLPERGQITIFNRSHYENVLISRVHPEIVLSERIPEVNTVAKVDKNFWARRYEQINHFEKTIIQSGTEILKFFLHLSKEEQAKRFLARIENKEKHWKFSSADITERNYWNQYQKAYEKALKQTSTKRSPWYIIPADDKWYTHLLTGKIILEKLRAMNPSFPPTSKEEEKSLKQAKEKLEKEQKQN
jgi:PPK2 family polyphosphate:nucleotide phosphotransferase